MNEKLWAIIDRNYQLLWTRTELMHKRLAELENAALDKAAIEANTNEITQELARLREENAILAAGVEEPPANPYGYELILDLHGCDRSTFNRPSLREFFKKLCTQIEMKRCKLHFWDDAGLPAEQCQTSPHTKGTSAVQFILTSSVVIHTLDLLDAAYVNIFSCKLFDPIAAEQLTREWFAAKECRSRFIPRV